MAELLSSRGINGVDGVALGTAPGPLTRHARDVWERNAAADIDP